MAAITILFLRGQKMLVCVACGLLLAALHMICSLAAAGSCIGVIFILVCFLYLFLGIIFLIFSQLLFFHLFLYFFSSFVLVPHFLSIFSYHSLDLFPYHRFCLSFTPLFLYLFLLIFPYPFSLLVHKGSKIRHFSF